MLKCFSSRLNVFLYVCICVTFSSILSGCAAFQKITLDYVPEPHEKIISSYVIKSDVRDDRSYVKSGRKRDSYLGHYRAGYGNTWDVLLRGGNSLAEQFAIDILKELKACGFQTSPLSGNRALRVDIKEFNFDAYINGRFWYDIQVSVLDSENNTLASSTIEDEHVIKGSVWVGPTASFPREIPKIYNSIIEEIVRNNDTILNALK